LSGPGFAVFVAAGVFAPWAQRGSPAGYHFIFAHPSRAIHVDHSRLFVEWIIATVIGVGFYFAAPGRTRK